MFTRPVLLVLWLGLLTIVSSSTSKLIKGPYSVDSLTLDNPANDKSDTRVIVTFPTNAPSTRLVAYAHGLGNNADDYKELFEGLASFGYTITSHWSCKEGCQEDRKSLPDDPLFFGNYYKQQLLTIDWAKEQAALNIAPFDKIDFSDGVGIAGHSMGGQSALFSSSYANATDHNITSAAMHHAFTHEYPAPKVPFLAFTGGLDYVAWPSMTKNFYGNPDSDVTTKGIVDRTSANHFEPEDNFQPWESYNPLVPQFTAAWFKLTIDKKQEEFGFDFHEMIFGDSKDSICNGGDGYMNTCEMLD